MDTIAPQNSQRHERYYVVIGATRNLITNEIYPYTFKILAEDDEEAGLLANKLVGDKAWIRRVLGLEPHDRFEIPADSVMVRRALRGLGMLAVIPRRVAKRVKKLLIQREGAR